jgi:hypothetical protein
MRARHLRHKVDRRFGAGLRPDAMMQVEERRPIGGFRSPLFDFLQIGGAISQRIGAPGEQKHIFDGSQFQDVGRDGFDAEDDEPALSLAHLAAKIAHDFLRRDLFESGLNRGVEGR